MSFITRKMELYVANDDKNVVWEYLRNLDSRIYKMANESITALYLSDAVSTLLDLGDGNFAKKIKQKEKEISDLIKLNKKTEDKDLVKNNDIKIKFLYKEISEIQKLSRETFSKTFGTSIKNVAYQNLKIYEDISSYIRVSLANSVSDSYNNNVFDVKCGKRSLSSYKKGMPIPFTKDCMKFSKDGSDVFMKWIKITNKETGEVDQIKFGINFGRDKSNNKIVMDRLLSKQYSFRDSTIQIKDKKIFLFLVVDIPDEIINTLDKDLVVGVDLGLRIPAFVSLSNGKDSKGIGSIESFLKVRTQIQRQKRGLQRSLVISKGGKGRTKKMKSLDFFKTKERNFVRTFNHKISKSIIDYAKKYNAGTINLEFLEGFSKEKKDSFVLRNWSFYELQNMIEQKSKRYGMSVQYVDPYHTSQTCAVCGHYEKGQRKTQSEFICKNPDCECFDKVVNADKNASLVIAKSKKYVTKKSDCEYFKKNKIKN